MKKNKTLIKNIDYVLFAITYMICGYQMDKHKNYSTNLSNQDIKNYLTKYNVDNEIINCINKNINLSGKIIYLVNNADSDCIIVIRQKQIYIIFIGTQVNFNDKISMIKDIFTDICLGLESVSFLDPSIKIHGKYQDNMNNQNLIKKIVKIIDENKDKKIILSGHSMGCGLSLYTSLYLLQLKQYQNIDLKLINFDAPKLGNIKLKKYISNMASLKYINIINNNDIVPSYPFIFPNYCNVFEKTYLLNNDESGEVKLIKNISRNILYSHSIKDHISSNIMKNIYYVWIKSK